MHKVIPSSAILVPDKAERVFDGVIYDVYQWEQQNFDDSVAIFEMLKRPDTVSAICIVDGHVIVLEDEQPHRGVKLTLPGGRVDDTDKTPLAAVKREVQEETGYTFQNWRLVSVVQPQAKIEWFVHTYVAWGVSDKGDHNHDVGEKITAAPKTLEELKMLATNGVGFLGESRHLIEEITKLEHLKNIPEFMGQAVDR